MGHEIDEVLIEKLAKINFDLSKAYLEGDKKRYEDLKKTFKDTYIQILKAQYS
jgi:hypothetical protein